MLMLYVRMLPNIVEMHYSADALVVRVISYFSRFNFISQTIDKSSADDRLPQHASVCHHTLYRDDELRSSSVRESRAVRALCMCGMAANGAF